MTRSRVVNGDGERISLGAKRFRAFSANTAMSTKDIPAPRYIPSEELEKLMNTPMNSNAQEFTRDMFVFSCFTGLAYADLRNLSVHQIFKDDDGTMWLNINRQKTGSSSFIPLLDIPVQLIEKYRGTAPGDRVFPMKGNSIMNRHLKKIARHCGIDRRLTWHAARHTFATVCRKLGENLAMISESMGHKNDTTTDIYFKSFDADEKTGMFNKLAELPMSN
jgi:integrase